MLESLKAGWEYSSKQMGAEFSAQVGNEYVAAVGEAVQIFSDDINNLGTSSLGAAQLKGFVAEYWHADTFNIDAALKGSGNRAYVEGSTEHASVDISTNFGKDYSSKYIRTPKGSVDAQAKNVIQAYHEYLRKPRQGEGMSFSDYLEKYGYTKDTHISDLVEDYKRYLANCSDKAPLSLEQYMELHAGEYDITRLLTSVYSGQDRLIPTDQLKEAIEYLNREIAKESGKETSNRATVLANYKETLEKLVDRVSDGNGTESTALSKEEAEAIAGLIKEGKFKPEDFGFKISDLVTAEYILHQALQAGYTSAAITLVLQLAPEIIKSVDYLIKNKEIDVRQIKKLGVITLSASAEGFLRGSISAALTISCKAGKLGDRLISVNPSVIGALTVIVLDVAKSSVLVAASKMTPQEMGEKITKELIISASAIAGGKFIGGAIGQIVAPELPVVGYMLGSLIGSCIASVIVEVGEKRFLSFCVDTGFTCFGLVKQDYNIPEDTLRDLGISLSTISEAVVNHSEIKHTALKHTAIKHTKYETIELVMVKRGIIGINRIGYL